MVSPWNGAWATTAEFHTDDVYYSDLFSAADHLKQIYDQYDQSEALRPLLDVGSWFCRENITKINYVCVSFNGRWLFANSGSKSQSWIHFCVQ